MFNVALIGLAAAVAHTGLEQGALEQAACVNEEQFTIYSSWVQLTIQSQQLVPRASAPALGMMWALQLLHANKFQLHLGSVDEGLLVACRFRHLLHHEAGWQYFAV